MEIASQLFVSPKTVLRTVQTFLHTGDVNRFRRRIGRLTGSTTLFPHEEYVLIDCLLRMPQIQLHEIENFIFDATGSSFGLPTSLRSRRYSRAQGGKLEIPPAQKLSILSSAHRAHDSAHTNVFAVENQSERKLLIMILAGLQCSKRCQFNNYLVFFCHGEQSNSHDTFAKTYTVNIMLFPNPVGKIAITSLPSNKCWINILCSCTLQDDGLTDSR